MRSMKQARRPKRESGPLAKTVYRTAYCTVWAVGLLALLAACSPKSPEEKVAELRSYYTAKPVGFIVNARPVETVDPMLEVEAEVEGDGDAMEVDAEAADAEDGEDEMAAPVEIRQDVLIDILLQHDSSERLPLITLDISMVDPDQVEKGHWRIQVETADLPKATGSQFTHELVDIEYVEGDAFSVEVRHPVPAAERGEYPEFSNLGG